MSILEAKHLTHRYPQTDLFADFSLSVEKGEWVVIIGANGSGKTTLLKLLAQVDLPQSGTVTLYNPDGSPMKDATRRVYVGQHDFSRFDAFPATALETVVSAYTPRLGLFHNPSKAQIEAAKDLLSELGLGERIHTQLSQLSGGQRQRVFIARALILKPDLLFLDEPTSALDPAFTLDLFRRLKQAQNEGMTLVMVTHDLALAQTVADRILCLEDRSVVELDALDIREELAHRHSHIGGHRHESL